ncbi:MAG: helix-turn-helix domain-containing protein [Vicinamibacterales bacterium]
MLRCNFDLHLAAQELGISYRAMVERLRKLGRQPRIE